MHALSRVYIIRPDIGLPIISTLCYDNTPAYQKHSIQVGIPRSEVTMNVWMSAYVCMIYHVYTYPRATSNGVLPFLFFELISEVVSLTKNFTTSSLPRLR